MLPLRSPASARVGDDAASDVVHGTLQRFATGIAVESWPAPTPGRRRRRVWQLPHHCHCPLVGLSVPPERMARLVRKQHGAAAPSDAYELHVALVRGCGERGPLAEALQRELDRRHAASIRRYADIDDADALLQAFELDLRAGDAGAAVWAAWSHACGEAVQEVVYRRAHMHQHAAGAHGAADRRRLLELEAAAVAQRQEAERLRRNAEELRRAKAEQAADDRRTIATLRLQLVSRDAAVAALQAQLDELRQSMPDLPERQALAQLVDELRERNRELARRADERGVRPSAHDPSGDVAAAPGADGPAMTPPKVVDDARAASTGGARTVLCVGGRTRAVSQYRELVERRGARFLHHDGGIEDNVHALQSSLDAADVVFCQAGCVSHNAYAVVKVHCKRAGKNCVYLDRPSVARFAQGLRELLPC